MKRLLIIPTLLLCISAFGQFTKPQLYTNINENIRLKTYSPTRISAVLDSIVATMNTGGGGSYTFDNGIYDDSGTIKLGGNPLVENTTIDAANYSFGIEGQDGTEAGRFAIDYTNFSLEYENIGSALSGIIGNSTGLQLYTTDAFQIAADNGVSLLPPTSGTGNLRFLELAANGSNYVGFRSPNSISSNVLWTLPSADGSSGQYLKTNGSGVLSWDTPSGGGGGITIGSTSITGGTSGRLLTSGTTVGEQTLGTGISTWLSTPSWTNFNSAITGTAPYWSLSGGGTLTGANTIIGSTTNTITFDFPSIGVTDYDSFVLTNSTAATSGNQKKSPIFMFKGYGWKTNTTAASQPVEQWFDLLPVQGAANPSSILRHYSSINDGAKTSIGWWFASDGTIRLGTSPNAENTKIYSISTANAASVVNGGAGTFFGYTASTVSQYPLLVFGMSSTNALTATAGTAQLINYNGTFAPTSGTADFTGVGTTLTINQTGGASGVSRIFNPSVTVTAGTSLTGYYWNPTTPGNLTGNNLSFHAVSGNVLLPASSYINIGSTVGSSGYGFGVSTNIKVKHSGGSWNDITSGSLGLTDNAIPRTDGTSGNLLQSSGVTISDTDVITALGFKQGSFTSGGTSYQTQQATLGGYAASSTGFTGLSNPSDYANNTVLYVEFTAVLMKSDGTASVSATVQSRFRKNNSGTWIADSAGTAVTSDATVMTTLVGDINGGVPGITWTSGAFAGTYAGGFSSKITAYTY